MKNSIFSRFTAGIDDKAAPKKDETGVGRNVSTSAVSNFTLSDFPLIDKDLQVLNEKNDERHNFQDTPALKEDYSGNTQQTEIRVNHNSNYIQNVKPNSSSENLNKDEKNFNILLTDYDDGDEFYIPILNKIRTSAENFRKENHSIYTQNSQKKKNNF